MNFTRGRTAVMAKRKPLASRGHDLFCTPPWAVRALFENVLPLVNWDKEDPKQWSAWDPCAGLGHMVEALKEYCGQISASDIVLHPLEGGGTAGDLGIQPYDFLSRKEKGRVDWIITNPPFATAELFLPPALAHARKGVAFFERIQWLEGAYRYASCLAPHPPSLVAAFVERVALCAGGYDPDCSSATMYAWFLWAKNRNGALPGPLVTGDGFLFSTIPLFLIPPGLSILHFKESDRELAKRCVPGFVPPSKKGKQKKLPSG